MFYFVQLFLLKLKGYNWYHSITNFYFLTDNCYYSKSLSEDDVKRLKEIEAAFENFEVTRPRFYFKESKYNAAFKGYVGKAFPEVVQPLMLKLEAIFEEQNILHLLEDDPAGFKAKYDQYLETPATSRKAIQKEILQLAKEHKNYQKEMVEKVFIASRTDLLKSSKEQMELKNKCFFAWRVSAIERTLKLLKLELSENYEFILEKILEDVRTFNGGYCLPILNGLEEYKVSLNIYSMTALEKETSRLKAVDLFENTEDKEIMFNLTGIYASMKIMAFMNAKIKVSSAFFEFDDSILLQFDQESTCKRNEPMLHFIEGQGALKYTFREMTRSVISPRRQTETR